MNIHKLRDKLSLAEMQGFFYFIFFAKPLFFLIFYYYICTNSLTQMKGNRKNITRFP